MDKIVLIPKKREDGMDDLVKCLKYLFPECSVEVVWTNHTSLPCEKK